MIAAADRALLAYEQRRAAANDGRIQLIRATVTVNLQGDIYTFPAIGASVNAILESAEELAGDDPFGVSVMVCK